jgi:hypothetical protein
MVAVERSLTLAVKRSAVLTAAKAALHRERSDRSTGSEATARQGAKRPLNRERSDRSTGSASDRSTASVSERLTAESKRTDPVIHKVTWRREQELK